MLLDGGPKLGRVNTSRVGSALLPDAAAKFRHERVFGAGTPNTQVGAVGIGESGAFQALPISSLIVVDDWKKTIGGRIVHE